MNCWHLTEIPRRSFEGLGYVLQKFRPYPLATEVLGDVVRAEYPLGAVSTSQHWVQEQAGVLRENKVGVCILHFHE